MPSALEAEFPFETVDLVAEVESYRKEVNRPTYHVHKWWANRLGSVFRAMLIGAAEKKNADTWARFYSDGAYEDFVVLDPFMGSGTTIGEAAKLRMRGIGCDINPVSTFAVRQSLTRVSPEALEAAFADLERRVAPRIRRLYTTLDRETGNPIPILYTFWVVELTLPDGEVVPLFKDYVFSSNAYPKKKPEARIVCPQCGDILVDRFDSTATRCSSCGTSFNPQAGRCDGKSVVDAHGTRHAIKTLIQASGNPPRHRMYALMALRANGKKVYLKPSAEDRALYAQCSDELRHACRSLPTMGVRPGHNTNQARGYNFLHWRDFFNDRQLLALSLLRDAILEIEDVTLREQFLCLFSGTLEFNNLFCSFKGEGTGAVRHMFSHHILKPERTPLENSVWGTEKSSGTFSTLFRSRLLRAQEYLRRPFEITARSEDAKLRSEKVYSYRAVDARLVDDFASLRRTAGGVLLLNGDSSSLAIPDASVDAVITDPPYFDFVHYSELSDFFFAWLAPALRETHPGFERRDSSHDGEVQDRDPNRFAQKIARVFAECRRVLKPGGVLAFTFHHSAPGGWFAIHEALAVAGFVVAAAHPIKAEMSVGNPKSAAKDPINIDAILVCRKTGEIAAAADDLAADVEVLLRRFKKIGRTLSRGDVFVIRASQVLRHASITSLDSSRVRDLLDEAYTASRSTPPPPVDWEVEPESGTVDAADNTPAVAPVLPVQAAFPFAIVENERPQVTRTRRTVGRQ